MSQDKPKLSIALLQCTPELNVSIDVTLQGNGEVVFAEEASGSAAAPMSGGSSYERWISIPAASKDALLFALLQQAYQGDSHTFSKIRELMDAKGIRYSTFSW